MSGSGSNAGMVDGASSMNSLSSGYDPLSQPLITPNVPLNMNVGTGDGASHSHIASESSHRSKSVNAFDGEGKSDISASRKVSAPRTVQRLRVWKESRTA